ncbi:hypothetical protein [Parasporobacterium paucivorans]|uniref:Flp pilus assembly protein TadB n=1 Tax=Parasporobacterium paucivorans DSM 15970 TaxID=1122934 RepID=A0A1M6FVA5_9FIRM|nr:hypothetical protein [Parasporobacterium paucivorans]SHJ01614.1 hypothetical protein SAMN02745691_01211 [Parasporobacterium paucivorans DSM 15970]
MKLISPVKEFKQRMMTNVSIRNFSGGLILFLGAVMVTSLLYRLNVLYMAVLLIVGLVVYPVLTKSKSISRYEENRFTDVCSYLEQMCSSFQKDAKILNALKDSRLVVEGRLGILVDEAAAYIENGICHEKDIYTEAFQIIEKEYSCRRMVSLHEFMVKVEMSGGDYHNSLNIILRDLHLWMERTILFQRNIATTKVNYVVVLFLSIISCTMAMIMSGLSRGQSDYLAAYLDITGYSLYQMMTALFILSCMMSLVLIYKKLTGSWLDFRKSETIILGDYKTATKYDTRKAVRRLLPLMSVLSLAGIVLLFFGKYWQAVLVFLAALFIFSIPSLKYKMARRSTIEEIKMAFPEWLREITLNLQYQTIQMAIQFSYDGSPVVLKESLQKFIGQLHENPKGIEPYHHYLSEFDISEITSAMRILYSMSELSHEKSQEMLNVLTERNYSMIDKAEKIYDKNKIATIKQLLYMPMIFSMCKIFTDLILFSNSFFSGFSQIGNFIQ